MCSSDLVRGALSVAVCARDKAQIGEGRPHLPDQRVAPNPSPLARPASVAQLLDEKQVSAAVTDLRSGDDRVIHVVGEPKK